MTNDSSTHPSSHEPVPAHGDDDAAAGWTTPAPYEAIVKCVGLAKVFRDFWLRSRVRAVDGVDLEVCRGEVFGLLGPNGSGKSTTIKMILGLLYPSSGRIAVFGKRPEDVAIKKQIGYLPEDSNLYPFLNARETLEYYARLFHLDRRHRQRRIDMLLEMVGLEAAQRRPVGHYSKGMQRRIGLAGALINDPQLLILDEPTNGLDPIGTRQIKDLILELSRRQKTVLLCSHLLADVEDVCSRVAIMFGGKIRATGSVDDLLVRQDATTIQVSQIDDETVQRIESLLQDRGQHIEKIQKPRQKLETLFLEIIRQAQAEGVTTSGVRAGGRIAPFLSESEPAAAAVSPKPVDPPQTAPPDKPQKPEDVPQIHDAPPPPSVAAGTPLLKQTLAAVNDTQSPEHAQASSSEDISVIDRLVRGKAAFTPAESPAGNRSDPPQEPPPAEPLPGGPTAVPDRPPVAGQENTASQSQEIVEPSVGDPVGASDSAPQDNAASSPSCEEPDTGFLHAIDNVEPFDPDKDDTPH